MNTVQQKLIDLHQVAPAQVAQTLHDVGFHVIPLHGPRERTICEATKDATQIVIDHLCSQGAHLLSQDGVHAVVVVSTQDEPKSHAASVKTPAVRGYNVYRYEPAWWQAGAAIPLPPELCYTARNGTEVTTGKRSPFHNIGIRTGTRLPDGGFLVVVDVDIKGRVNGLAALTKLCREVYGQELRALFPETFSVRTPSGGYHWYYRVPELLRQSIGSIAEGIDIKCRGNYVVAPGSRNIQQQPYVIDPQCPWIQDLPAAAVDLLRSKQRRDYVAPEYNGVLPPGRDPEQVFEILLRKYPSVPAGSRHSTLCSAAGTARNLIEDEEVLATVIRRFADHHGLSERDSGDLDRIVQTYCEMEYRPAPSKGKKQAPPPPGIVGAAYEAMLMKDMFGRILGTEYNVSVLLEYHPRWQGRLLYDTLRASVQFEGRAWTDSDDTSTQIWLQREFAMAKVSRSTVSAAVEHVALQHRVQPIEHWLSGLDWDGQPRVATWLTTCLGVTDTPYTRSVGTWWLISAVARAFKPGCKVDSMLILEGPQAAGKSTALRILAGDPYILEDVGDLGSKDTLQLLRGKWIVEIAELDAFRKADDTLAKKFLSTQVDTYRRSYGKHSQDYPRQCVFAGTTNKHAYLKDDTGNRRYWPVVVGEIDLARLRAERDQLWAEATTLYLAGARWYPETQAAIALCGAAQAERLEDDAWDATIREWVADVENTTMHDIMQHALQIEVAQRDQRQMKRVAAVLRKLGWKERHTKYARRWERGPDAEPRRASGQVASYAEVL